MKKMGSVIVYLLLVSLYTSGCTPESIDCSKPEVFCVGLVTDVGRIDDKSVNQSAWEGIQQAKKDSAITWIQYIETTDARDYGLNIAVLGDARYDVIVTVGFASTNSTIAAATKYPNTYFIGVDQIQDTSQEAPSNLVGLVFPEDEAGFLIGALAEAMSTAHHIGAVCGSDGIPSVWRYCEGYRAGAAYADVKLNNTTQVSIIYHNDVGMDKTLIDPVWGTQMADSLIAKGADVIFGAGRKTGNGAIVEAAARGIYVIGYDIDQYYTLPEAAPMMLSSAMKEVTPSVTELVTRARDTQNSRAAFPSGNFTGTAGFAPYHDLDSKVPLYVKSMMEELNTDLLNGTIRTNVPTARP